MRAKAPLPASRGPSSLRLALLASPLLLLAIASAWRQLNGRTQSRHVPSQLQMHLQQAAPVAGATVLPLALSPPVPQPPPPPPPPAKCELPTAGSAWDKLCDRLQHVCVDQQSIILYEDQFQGVKDLSLLPRPAMDAKRVFRFPFRNATLAGRQRKGSDGLKLQSQPLIVRPASGLEAAAYLRNPVFSTCTVPVVVHAIWPGNSAHQLVDLVAPLQGALQQTAWQDHIKLVVATPFGLDLTPPQAQLLPALSNLSVQSMAEFSRRLRDEDEEQAAPSQHGGGASWQPPPSWEGGEQRCFQQLYVCANGFPDGSPAGGSLVPTALYQAGQRVVQYVLKRQARGAAAGDADASVSDSSSGGTNKGSSRGASQGSSGSSSSSSSSEGSGGGEPRQLRIAIMRRESQASRQILNAAELLERCNTWRYQPPNSTAAVTATCKEVTTPDVASGVAATQEADVLIGMHGANIANAWFMRPGSSVVEIIPHQFDELVPGALSLSVLNAKDKESQILWWLAVVCDPQASTPGQNEAKGRGDPAWYSRDRSATICWEAIEAVLHQVVALQGSRKRYLEYWEAGRHRFNMEPGGALKQGPRCRMR